MSRWEEVHRLRNRERLSVREIARRLGMSRNTVSKLLTLEHPPANERPGSRSLLDPYKDEILALLEREPKMPATVIRRRLAELGYRGGMTILKDYLVTIRPQFLTPYASATSPRISLAVTGEQADLRSHRSEIDLMGLFAQPDPERAMVLISTDFEIVAVNRAFERIHKKPMVELLGKKCYWEFERRKSVCPHCPGTAALATGNPHTIDVKGIAGDGCQYMVRVTTYQIAGPAGQLVGFVEVEEDITEQKRSERLLEQLKGLEASVAAFGDTNSLVRQALNSAFSLEGIDFGCAYVRDRPEGEYRIIAQRGVSRDLAEVLARQTSEPKSGAVSSGSSSVPDADGSGRPTAVAFIPIIHNGTSVARLLVGSLTYTQFPSATLAALDALGKMAGGAIAGLAARQLQKEMHTYLKALFHFMPVPVWCIDDVGGVIVWNRAAEKAFGWKEQEMLNVRQDLSTGKGGISPEAFLRLATFARDASEHQFQCLNRHGRLLRVVAAAMPLPRAVESQDTQFGRVIVAEVSEAEGSLPFSEAAAPDQALIALSERAFPLQPSDSALLPRVLAVDRDDEQRQILVEVLSGLGASVTPCASASTAIVLCAEVVASRHRFDAVICELLPGDGYGGLELAASLHKIDPQIEVVLSADSAIAGLEGHGLAGALVRPFTREAVRVALAGALTRRNRAQRADA